MHILSIISHKGGAGKTSSAVMLAEDLARRGVRVLLIDADRQNSSGLLLGIHPITSAVTSTGAPGLRYLSCADWSLQELPARLEALRGRFDVVVVDTPSLDDPLARTWLCLSTAAVLAAPVEPLSIWTLPAAEKEILELRAGSNPELNLLGILPTLYNAAHAKQPQLLQDLMQSRAIPVLSPPAPWDANLAQRAAQNAPRLTEASPQTRAAYHTVNNVALQAWGIDLPRRTSLLRAFTEPSTRSRAHAPAASARPGRTLLWGLCVAAALGILAVWLATVWQPFATASPNGGPAAVSSGKGER